MRKRSSDQERNKRMQLRLFLLLTSRTKVLHPAPPDLIAEQAYAKLLSFEKGFPRLRKALFLLPDLFDCISRVFDGFDEDIIGNIRLHDGAFFLQIDTRFDALERIERIFHTRTAMRTTHTFDK